MLGVGPIRLKTVFSLWALFIFWPCPVVPAAEQLQQYITSGGYVVKAGNKELLSYRENDLFIPASILKIATALEALEVLGPSYRFKTEFYERNESAICIKGYGDPFLVSEYIAEIADALKNQGISVIKEIILDDTYFHLFAPAPGSENSPNPYDAVNSALAVNFNSLPLQVTNQGEIKADEPQTPFIPLMLDIGSKLSPGHHRVNVSAFPNTDGLDNTVRYPAELFAALLKSSGIKVSAQFKRGSVESSDRHIYTYKSRLTVAQIIESCFHYSNNFIANQLYLSAGAAIYGPPGTWGKAQQAMSQFLQKHKEIIREQFYILEGSGLSPGNRVTPAFMISLLEAFKPYAGLLREENSMLIKSGTMNGVYSYAGYFRSGIDLDPFVIILNQPENTRKHVLKELHKQYLFLRKTYGK